MPNGSCHGARRQLRGKIRLAAVLRVECATSENKFGAYGGGFRPLLVVFNHPFQQALNASRRVRARKAALQLVEKEAQASRAGCSAKFRRPADNHSAVGCAISPARDSRCCTRRIVTPVTLPTISASDG